MLIAHVYLLQCIIASANIRASITLFFAHTTWSRNRLQRKICTGYSNTALVLTPTPTTYKPSTICPGRLYKTHQFQIISNFIFVNRHYTATHPRPFPKRDMTYCTTQSHRRHQPSPSPEPIILSAFFSPSLFLYQPNPENVSTSQAEIIHINPSSSKRCR